MRSTSTGFRSSIGVLALSWLLAGCADLGYYTQSVGGHLSMLHAAKPVNEWLADPATPEALKQRLLLAQRIRSFATQELKLPDNPSYTRYADLQRRAVVWNVVAAPVDSLAPKQWCFVVAGCVTYRGYFDEAGAQGMARQLQSEGWETTVYGVPAYSTLGWLNWLGGDPLLNTFIGYPDAELARMLFHELAHQVLYVKGDTAFNESFATAVERLGGAQWLAARATPQTRAEFERATAQREEFRKLVQSVKWRLAQIYKKKEPNEQDGRPQAAIKKIAYDGFRADWGALRARWQAASGLPDDIFARRVAWYDQWVAGANNASFAAQGVYEDLVPAFEALFAQVSQGQPSQEVWPRFYDAVRKLAELPPASRQQALQALLVKPNPP
jgi:predicted aminopeptidase